MELVIKIDEAEYNKICNYDGMNVTRMMSVIQNGTPLPKGHDRLVEARAVIKALFGKQTIDDVPTIIEADVENSNGADN